MSAPGVQFNSEGHVAYFHPTVRQYLQGIRDALASDNLPVAQQAFAQLTKTISLPGHGIIGQTGELTARVSEAMGVLGTALEAGDFSAARQAVGQLRVSAQSVADEQARKQQATPDERVSANGSDVSAGDSISQGGPTLNVRA